MKNQSSMLRTLSQRSFRSNRGRNLVAVLAIVLTTMMFTTLFTLAQSMRQNMTEMYLWQSGTMAHASTKQITDAQIDQIAAHPDIVSFGKSIVLGVAKNQRLAGRQLEIRYGSDQYARYCFAYPTTGKMPDQKDEIALDTLVLGRLGIPLELGQSVTLEWENDSDTFTLCGWWEGNLSSYASMAWVSEAFALEACGNVEEPEEGQLLGRRMMSIAFSDNVSDNKRLSGTVPKNIDRKIEKVLLDCGLTELAFETNLAYSAEVQNSIFVEYLPMYGGMVFVFLAGYLIIFNVFQISVAADILFYGKLKTLGTTKKQMKKLIYGQGSRLCLIGIPIGLAVGYLLGVLLVPVLIPTEEIEVTTSANPVIFIGSALFAYVTVVVSCMLPARLAGKVSPIEALRYTDADSGAANRKRKSKNSKNGVALHGMAWANLWRNRKRTVMVICSLTLGLVLMSFFYARNVSFDLEKYLMDLTVADYEIDDATNKLSSGYDPQSHTISDALLADIAALGAVEADGRLYSGQAQLYLSEQAKHNLCNFYTAERLEDFASYDPSFPAWKEGFDAAVNGQESTYTIYGADGLILEAAASKNYILDGAFDAEKFATGDYCLAIGPSISPGTGAPTYSVGEKIKLADREFEVMAVLRPLQPMVAGSNSIVFDLPLVICADVFCEIWPENNLRKYYFDVADEAMEEAETLLANYQQTDAVGMNIVSRQSMAKRYEAQTRASAVMGYAISIIIALVGVLNFVNSMVTAIITRKREFAMIQSIGMTKKQLRRMLTFEGLYYAGMTLTAAYILGALAVGVIVRAVTADGFSTFHFTLLPLICCTPVLVLFAILIPYLCFKNLEQQSVVERIRATN
ncbi:MAG: ABC transporter permease [Lachnospiraceae bacterium]|nr:ABC transporter permease [Lachnospiraceae bacterium]